MTICSTMLAAIDRRLEAKASLEDIGCELCDAVDDPRGKALRIIKRYKGVQYLKDNADWLGYDAEKIHDSGVHPNGGRKTKVGEDDEKNLGKNISEVIYPEQSEPMQMIQSDSFEPEEIVYESQPEPIKPIPECCSQIPPTQPEKKATSNLATLKEEYIPTLLDVTVCPCGCGYGYCESNKKWYNQVQMAQLDDN